MTDTVAVPDQIVRFGGGPRRPGRKLPIPQTVVYKVPKNTLDPRYLTCVAHHVACDCREAEQAEMLNEYRIENHAVGAALDDILAGHPTYDPDSYTRNGGKCCQCTGCQIARAIHYYPKRSA